jgi:hypothetical protein
VDTNASQNIQAESDIIGPQNAVTTILKTMAGTNNFG